MVERLGSDDPAAREAARSALIRSGRSVYPALRTALSSLDEDLREQAFQVAYALGIDPATHRPWEELWAEYVADPTTKRRRRLIELGGRIDAPRLTLLRKIDAGAMLIEPVDAPPPASISAAEWDCWLEVTGVPETDEEWRDRLGWARSSIRARALYWWGVSLNCFGAPRAETLGAWSCLVKVDPSSDLARRIRRDTEILRRMVDQDGAAKFGPLEEMTPEELAAYWVYRLRDEGFVDVARPIRDLGRAAIPRLLNALEDDGLTRYYDGSSFRRIRDAALELLEQVTGVPLAKHPEASDAASFCRAWWERSKNKSEAEWLEEWIEGEGSYPRSGACERLFRLKREGASRSLVAALHRPGAEDQAAAARLLGRIGGETAVRALRDRLDAPELQPMVLRAVAEALSSHGDDSGLRRIRGRVRGGRSEDDYQADLAVLVRSGRPEFVRFALEWTAGDCDASVKLQELQALREYRGSDADVERTALNRLAPLLHDTRPCGANVSYSNGVGYSLRVCDAAAETIARWFLDVRYVPSAPAPERTAQLAELRRWAGQASRRRSR
jgi:HEAT repeat protein